MGRGAARARPRYWNAPFGAVLSAREVHGVDDGLAFIRTGLDMLGVG